MRRIRLFITLFVLILLFCFCFSLSALANSNESLVSQYEENASAIYFYSYDAKSVLYKTGDNKILKPASTVKIITGLLACEKLESRLNEKIIITKEMLIGHTGTSMGLEAGMTVSVLDLLYGTICGGNNDASQALAVICSGNIESFVVELNEYATKLGMTQTFYTNPSGLDDDLSQTTISDVAILSHNAVKNDLYIKISSAKKRTVFLNNEEKVIYNRNALISNFTSDKYINENVFGLIAGSTDEGGYVVSAVADINDSKYLCIVMGAESYGGEIYSYKIANELISIASESFEKIKLFSQGEEFSRINVNYTLDSEDTVQISCVLKDDIYGYLPKNANLSKDLKYTVFLHDNEIDAPIEKGAVVGGINVYYKNKIITTGYLISNETIEANSFLLFMGSMQDFLLSRYFLIFFILFFIAILIFLYFDRMYLRRKRVGYIKYKKFF